MSDAFWAPVAKNWDYWIGHVPTARAVLVGVVVVVLVAVLAGLRRSRRAVVAGAVVSAAGLVVPFWYQILRNHSQIHAFFTYRSITVALGLLAFAWLAASHAPGPAAVAEAVQAADQDEPAAVTEMAPASGAASAPASNDQPDVGSPGHGMMRE